MYVPARLFRRLLAVVALAALGAPFALAADYDPLKIDAGEPKTLDLKLRDETRQRDLPLKIFLPKVPESTDARTPAPVVLFSHGLGGSREMGTYLGKHWSARGYVTVFLQHPGSDDALWRNEAPAKRLQALQEGASAENLALRLADVPAVLNGLEKWNKESGHELFGRLDLTRVGMSGHSFGALTTQGVSGQSLPLIGTRNTDARIKAALIMSPGSPRAGDPKPAFASVKIPWLLMTGTKDTARIGGQTVESRLAVFPALPEGSKYELVLHEGAHSAFTDRPLPGEQRHPNHHRVILALGTAFWDAYLKNDAAAKAWLDGSGPRTVLETEDKWQKK